MKLRRLVSLTLKIRIFFNVMQFWRDFTRCHSVCVYIRIDIGNRFLPSLLSTLQNISLEAPQRPVSPQLFKTRDHAVISFVLHGIAVKEPVKFELSHCLVNEQILNAT